MLAVTTHFGAETKRGTGSWDSGQGYCMHVWCTSIKHVKSRIAILKKKHVRIM